MIRKLPEELSNKIAAGEVVENPRSVVKELVENSIDAGASMITIEIENAGKRLIKISDNGSGIAKADLALLFERHATSKISKSEDIYAIKSLGFRGEALASIAAVSRIEMSSKTANSQYAHKLFISAGVQSEIETASREMGTTFWIRDLFYNTPARYKFLQSDRREEAAIVDLINKLALSRPDIRFNLIIDGREKLRTDGKNVIANILFKLYGREIVDHLWPLHIDDKVNNITINAYITDSEYTRGNRAYQHIFVNKRYVISKELQQIVNEAYKGHLMIGRFPAFVLAISVDERKIDVNIHPAKTEIKLAQLEIIAKLLNEAIAEAFQKYSQLPIASLEKEQQKPADKPKEESNADKYFQRYAQKRSSNIYLADHEKDTETESSYSLLNSNKADLAAEKDNYFSGFTEIDKIAKELFVDDQAEFSSEQLAIEPRESIQETLYHNLKVIGILFSTYIICQKGKSAFIIDQHAAHERALYEKFKLNFAQDLVASQRLAEAFIYHCDAQTSAKIEKSLNQLAKMGIEIENFGNNEWIIRAVPIISDTPFSEAAVVEILDSFEDFKADSLEEVEAEHIIRRSCRTAVKARDHLTTAEVYALLDLLIEYGSPYTCPHGRPIIIELTEYELEKKFKRVL